MNGEILTAAMAALTAAGIPAEGAYPGKAYPAITGPRAAVHIHSAQPGQRKMVLEIMLLTPKADGGVAGERLALAAVAALEAIGGSCSQSGCRYDGLIRAYSTSILAEFTDGMGFSAYLGDVQLEYAVEFISEQTRGAQLLYAMGEDAPHGVNQGNVGWQITLTEKIPLGAAEIAIPAGETAVRVIRDGGWELYTGCVWTKIRRSYSPAGMVRTMTGIAKTREGA